jgi:hypothetical protein
LDEPGSLVRGTARLILGVYVSAVIPVSEATRIAYEAMLIEPRWQTYASRPRRIFVRRDKRIWKNERPRRSAVAHPGYEPQAG